MRSGDLVKLDMGDEECLYGLIVRGVYEGRVVHRDVHGKAKHIELTPVIDVTVDGKFLKGIPISSAVRVERRQIVTEREGDYEGPSRKETT
jgi:hypothetical protein